MFVHDLIKIHLIDLGYLPNYPPHLISDAEMCNAFLPISYVSSSTDAEAWRKQSEEFQNSELNYFRDYYPLLSDELGESYTTLVNEIAYHLDQLKSSKDDLYILPDWVYTYMLGEVISINSSKLDIHDMLVKLGVDNMDDVFTAEASSKCLVESKEWLRKQTLVESIHRPPTMFGEPHVLKSLRLKSDSLIVGN